MHREIRVPQDTRFFTRFGKRQLQWSGMDVVQAGTLLTISSPEIMFYDHRDQEVVSFRYGGKEYYMILSELNLSDVLE